MAAAPLSSEFFGVLKEGVSVPILYSGRGKVNVNGTAVTLLKGTLFDTTNWPSLSILIQGVRYAISSVTDNSHLTLGSSAGVINEADYVVGVNAAGTGAAFQIPPAFGSQQILSWQVETFGTALTTLTVQLNVSVDGVNYAANFDSNTSVSTTVRSINCGPLQSFKAQVATITGGGADSTVFAFARVGG